MNSVIIVFLSVAIWLKPCLAQAFAARSQAPGHVAGRGRLDRRRSGITAAHNVKLPYCLASADRRDSGCPHVGGLQAARSVSHGRRTLGAGGGVRVDLRRQVMEDRLQGDGPDQRRERDETAHQAHRDREAGAQQGMSVVSVAAAMVFCVAAEDRQTPPPLRRWPRRFVSRKKCVPCVVQFSPVCSLCRWCPTHC